VGEVWKRVEAIGDSLVERPNRVGLFVVGAAMLCASWAEVCAIMGHGGPAIKGIALRASYLEPGAILVFNPGGRCPALCLAPVSGTR
jgi:hypothetical protein